MISLRPYQTRCVDALLSNSMGIIQVPAGGGKTIIAATAIKAFVTKRRADKVAWLANTIDQCGQARAAFNAVGLTHDILVKCYASQPDLRGFQLVVVDECHHVPADTLKSILEPVTGVRWGLSATPFSGDVDRDTLTMTLLGGIIEQVRRDELIDAGHLAQGAVTMHHNSFGNITPMVEALSLPEFKHWWPPEMCNRVRYKHAYGLGILNCVERNHVIIRIANDEIRAGHSVLILVKEVTHGNLLGSAIPRSELCYSGLGKKKRSILLDRFKSGDVKCMLATSLADEGLDVPRASCLILAAGGRHAGRLEQRTGRVLRAFTGKERGVIHDFVDGHHFMLSAQSKARRKVYKDLGYTIEGDVK